MENRRDSSVWQSLAITFGGGLALGAVGMKLTQETRRPGPAPAEPGARPASHAGSAPLDPRLVDVIVAAVDARMHDHTARTERRIQEVQDRFQGQIVGIRGAVGEELNEFGGAISKLVAEQVAALVDARASAMEQSLEPRMIAAVHETLAGELSPLRARVEEKERELAELRHRLAEGEHTVLEVILAIGSACQQAADRAGAAASLPPAALPEAVPAVAPDADAEREAAVPAAAAAALDPRQPARPARLWRIPMVSSFVMMTMGLLLLHYL